MRFFFDNCMSPHHARGLAALSEIQKHEIIYLSDRFKPSADDVEWITALGVEGDWVVVSGEVRITQDPAQRKAWIESGLTSFFFGDSWSQSNYWNKATDLVRWRPEITRLALAHPKGFGFLAQKNAKEFRQIFPTISGSATR